MVEKVEIKPTVEFRQRMSQIRQKQWQDPEYREKMILAQRRRGQREKAVKAQTTPPTF